MQRLRHRPEHFMHRGNRMAFHRFQDGATLARLDPYADGEQVWLLHSGRDIAVTAEEVRDISKQVHGLDLPATRPEGGTCNCGARFAAIEARLDALEAAASRADENEALRARIAELEKAALDAALTASLASNPELYPPAPADPLGPLEALKAKIDAVRVPDEIRQLMEDGETVAEVRERLTPKLNSELSKLKNLRGLAGEDLGREAEIETLLGMLSRLGEG